MNRSLLSVALSSLAVGITLACVSQDDVERKSCSTDADCAAGQRCLETEVDLACVNVGGDVTYERDVAPILQARCVSCHAPTPSGFLPGIPNTFRLDRYESANGLLGAFAMRDRILARAVTAAYHLDSVDQSNLSDLELSDLLQSVMPPGAPLPVSEREVLRAWVHAGGPRGEPGSEDLPGDDAGVSDAGTPGDAGVPTDAGSGDAGSEPDAGTVPDAGVPDPCAGSTPATFTQVKANVFQGTCTGCHGNSGGMTVTDHADVVNVPAEHAYAKSNGLMRVKPNDPENSFLYIRIHDNPLPSGVDRMPQGATQPLDQAKTELVRGWICAGAPNN